MSIYRAILEEDLELGGVLDDNNCVELKEIEDVIADHDANEFEQSEAQEAEFGTDYGDHTIGDAEDILDESFMAIAEAQMDYNKLMMAIGIHEVNETAAGREVLYEAADIKGYIKRAKQWVVNFFKKVWQVLQRYAANIASAFKTNKGFAEKYAKEIKAGYDLYSKNHKHDNKMKMYTYEGLSKFLGGNEGWMDAVNSDSGVKKYIDLASNWSDQSGLTNEEVESTLAAYRGKLCGTDCSASEFREKLHNHVCGSSEKKEGFMPADAVIDALKSGKEIKTCRKAIDKAKTEYKEAIKKLDKIEKNFASTKKKSTEGDVQYNVANKQMMIITRATNLLQGALTAAQVARAVILSAARSRIAQARMYGQAYVQAANKGNEKYKGFQKESAEYGFLSNMDLV